MSDGLLDATYERLAKTGPEFGGGLSNHGPMAAEALLRLGRGNEVEEWVSGYLRNLEGAPRPRQRIRETNWRNALGDVRRVADWEAFLLNELRDAPWPAVLHRWWARLLPGISAGATHGVIRTAHAVRSLNDGETPQRIEEFARGLAYWAARFTLLPGSARTAGTATVDEALNTMPVLRGAGRGLITHRLTRLARLDGFPESVQSLEPPHDVPAALDGLIVAFADVYLRHADKNIIAFIHGVTAPAALQLVFPMLPRKQWRPSFDAIWQVGAALHAAYSHGPQRPIADDSVSVRDRESLIDAAVATRDEHAIKFTEACLRMHERAPRGRFLAAAEHAIERLA